MMKPACPKRKTNKKNNKKHTKNQHFTHDFSRLPEKEQKRVEEILAKSLRKERGEPIEDIITVPDDDDEATDEGTYYNIRVHK